MLSAPKALTAAALLSVALAAPAAAAAAAAPVSPPGSPAAAACHVRPLPVPAGTTGSLVSAGDPTGRWLVGSISAPSGTQAAVWHDRVLQPVDVPIDTVSFAAVNADGAIAGAGRHDGRAVPLALVDGEVVQLQVPAGHRDATATSISRTGTVGGFATRSDFTIAPVVWSLDDPLHPTLLSLPAGLQGGVEGMSPRGQAVVSARDENFDHERSFVYSPDFVRRELPASEPGRESNVKAVARGWAAGFEVDDVTGDSAVLRWPLDTRAPEVVSDDVIDVNAVNAKGVIAGERENALLIDGATEVPLPPLAPEKGTVATAVATNGHAAGFARDADDLVTAVTWRC